MDLFSQAPFLRLLIPFVSGIILGEHFFTSLPAGLFLFCAFLPAIVALTFTRNLFTVYYPLRWMYGFLVNALLVASGLLLIRLYYQPPGHHFSSLTEKERTILIVRLADQPVKRNKSFRITVKTEAVLRNQKFQNVSGKLLIYMRDSSAEKLSYGDRLLIGTTIREIEPPRNPGEFNFQKYMARQQVWHRCYVNEKDYRVLPDSFSSWSIPQLAYGVREKILSVLQANGLQGNDYAVIAGLLIGHREAMDPELAAAYSATGTMHVLAVSGMHVAIIYFLLHSLLSFLDKKKNARWLKMLLVLSVLWFYAFITGLSPSVLRAALMFSLVQTGYAFSREGNSLNMIGGSAFLLLLFHPPLLFDPGFQLSYAAVAGIILTQPVINYWWESSSWIGHQCWSLISVTLSATIGTFPLCIYYFHQFPVYFLPANLFIVPYTTFLLYAGIVLLILSPLTGVASLAGKIIASLAGFLNSMVMYIEQVPYSVIENISITLFQVVLIYLLLLTGILFLFHKKGRYLLLSLSCLLLITGIDLSEDLAQRRQRKWIVYSMPGRLAMEFVDGQGSIFLCDRPLQHDPVKTEFSTRNFRIISGIRHIATADITGNFNGNNFRSRKGMIRFYNRRVAIADSTLNFASASPGMQTDYLVIGPGIRSLKHSLTIYQPGKIIFSTAVNPFYLEKLKEEARTAGISFYSVKDKGAWVEMVNG